MTSSAQINRNHVRAMEFAARALKAKLEGDIHSAKRLFTEAFKLERRAAKAVETEYRAEPSRSILLRSAASLALDCEDFAEAERMVALALAGHPPHELADELRDLLEQIYFARHLDLRGMALDPTELQMSLKGEVVGFGFIESSQFLKRAETVERLLIRTAERRRGMPFRETPVAGKKGEKEFEVYLSTARAASYAVTLRLGHAKIQKKFAFANQVRPVEVIDDVLESLDVFNAGNVKELHGRIPDTAYYNNFTALAKKLAPDGNKVQIVGFTTLRGDEPKKVALTGPAGKEWTRQPSSAKTKVYNGRIRFADETSKKRKHPVFVVEDDQQNRSPQIRVQPGMLQDIVKPYWGQPVRVTVAISTNGSATMTDIRPIDEAGELSVGE